MPDKRAHLALVGAAMLALALIGPRAAWGAAAIGLMAVAPSGLYALRHLREIWRIPTELQPE